MRNPDKREFRPKAADKKAYERLLRAIRSAPPRDDIFITCDEDMVLVLGADSSCMEHGGYYAGHRVYVVATQPLGSQEIKYGD